MRLMLSKAGLDNARLNVIKAARDSRRERRAREKPGNAIMSSVALPEKFNEEVGCSIMFGKQQHYVFHAIDRCIRVSAGVGIPDMRMNALLNAYRACWMQHGTAEVLYSDGEGALNTDAAKDILSSRGAELRIRARGQRATTIEARSGVL